jgi:DNA-binding response OmpR family regulator
MIKILVADDSSTTREMIKNNLKLHFSSVDFIETSDGIETVEVATTRRPSIIILDVMMPKLNGYLTCQRIKENLHTKNIPVILLTMKKEETDKQWGLKCGADAYITKPFKTQDLVDAIKKFI